MDDKLRLKKACRKQPREGKLEDYYNINLPDKILGKGSFATVIKATTIEGNHPRAIKVLSKEKMNDKGAVKSEIEILAQMDHPNIVRLYETFEDDKNIYLVMELCRGGEVFDKIIEKGHFTESQARSIFTEIMHAVNYCHTNGVCHRDLKLENFLYLDNSPQSHIKVIDFGVAKSFAPHGHFREHSRENSKITMTERVGTCYYISPEVIAGSYDESTDIWSAGVILYILLSGVPPFNGKTDAEILEKIHEQTYTFDSAEWKNVSASAKNLIRNMLCTPRFRLKASQVLNHPWMLQEENKNEKGLNLNYDSMKNFTKARKLKKIAMTVIASQIEEEEVMDISDLFVLLDKKGDGVLTVEEMKASAKELNGSAHSKILKVLDNIDIDKRRGINYTEFIAATMDKSLYLKEDRLMEAFSILDKDGHGKITVDELRDFMGGDCPYEKSYYEQIIREADLNGDGMIDYYEFIQMMKKS